MQQRIRKLCAIGLILLMSSVSMGVSHAQGAPDAINAAISDLSSRVGVSGLQRADLDRWRWEQQTFPDAGLGCPDPDQAYAQQQITGYIFYLTYNGTEYEYHVSADQSIVRLCNQTAPEDTTNSASSEDYSNPLCPAPAGDVEAYPRSRVAIDVQATGLLAFNRLRDTPSTDAAILAEMPPEAVFTVVGGPQCDDEGIVWWQVDYDGVVGWTAEALGDDRYLTPQSPRPLPTLTTITVDNAAAVALLGRLQGNILPEIDFSPDGLTLAAAGDSGSNSVHLYSIAALDSVPRYIDSDETLASLTYHPNGTEVLVGTTDGTTHLWNLAPDAVLVEALVLNTHASDVLATAMRPSGDAFASAGVNAQLNDPAAYDRSHAIVLWDIESLSQVAIYDDATSPVLDMAFSPDGQQLAAVDTDGSVYLWQVNAPDAPTVLESVEAQSLAYSPNGQFLAVGNLNGSVRLLNPDTGDTITELSGHLGAVTELAFSPDSSVLATVSGDGTLRLWSTQTDENLAVVEIATDESVLDVAFSPRGDLIATATDGRRIDLFGIDAGD